MTDNSASRCMDCGANTTPCLNPATCPDMATCRHDGRGHWEWYMVFDAVWSRATGGPDTPGYLCIADLERRLGRPLNNDDFTTAPVNWLDRFRGEPPTDSPRLAAAKQRPAQG